MPDSSFVITLPDTSQIICDNPLTLDELAAEIGKGLARVAVAGRIDGHLVDASEVLDANAEVAIVTDQMPEGLEIIRHSCAHLLGHALKQLIPGVRMAIGPTIEHGFYYDIEPPEPLTPDFLVVLEERMRNLARQNYQVRRELVTRERALAVFAEREEPYKAEIIADLAEGETIALYHHQEYTDMCRGPHVTNTRHLRHFHLTHLAGAYWRGDSANQMLTRVYGIAFASNKAMSEYRHQLEEAARRDHRLIGRRMGLFHQQQEAPGMMFWHPRGWVLYQVCESYMRTAASRAGFLEVSTPQLISYSLWEASGHAEKFADNMFMSTSENRNYAVKPMNCPAHVQIFNQGVRSYRELPLRLTEFAPLHRNEASGTLHGLMRARRFSQDDAHVFCTEEQLQDEITACIDMLYRVYNDFGFTDIDVYLSTRPEQRIGSDGSWDSAEVALENALQKAGLDWQLQPGEGAFYGPKIEFSLRDCIGRQWQCGTVQVDFSMPGRLGAKYIDELGERRVPVMVHRAILGSLERFIGILLEHYDEGLPLWLAPVQAVVLNITDAQAGYADAVCRELCECGFRVEADLRNEKVGYKIREHSMARTPYILVVGNREVSAGTVAVRARSGEEYGSMTVEGLVSFMAELVQAKTLYPIDAGIDAEKGAGSGHG